MIKDLMLNGPRGLRSDSGKIIFSDHFGQNLFTKHRQMLVSMLLD